MADKIKKAKLMPKGGGVVIVISGWPLAAIIAGGIGYCAFRHYQNEHKNGDNKGFSFFNKTADQTKQESKELKESVKQKHEDIKAAVEESYRKSQPKTENVKLVADKPLH